MAQNATPATPTASPPSCPVDQTRIFRVQSWRLTGGRRERVTKLYRQRPAAEAWARDQLDRGRDPVVIEHGCVKSWTPLDEAWRCR